MTNSRTPAKARSLKQAESDAYLVVLHTPDRESLARLLRDVTLDIGPLRMRPDTKEVEVHLYATREQIAKLKKLGWKLDIGENLSEVGRQRQKEVGMGDRFEDGRVSPKGLGKKTRKGD